MSLRGLRSVEKSPLESLQMCPEQEVKLAITEMVRVSLLSLDSLFCRTFWASKFFFSYWIVYTQKLT